MTYVGCDFGCKHFQFLKNTKALSTRIRIFSKMETFSPYLKNFLKFAFKFVTTSCGDILWFNCLIYFPKKKANFFSSWLFGNDRQTQVLSRQIGHCPVTGRYFEPCTVLCDWMRQQLHAMGKTIYYSHLSPPRSIKLNGYKQMKFWRVIMQWPSIQSRKE